MRPKTWHYRYFPRLKLNITHVHSFVCSSYSASTWYFRMSCLRMPKPYGVFLSITPSSMLLYELRSFPQRYCICFSRSYSVAHVTPRPSLRRIIAPQVLLSSRYTLCISFAMGGKPSFDVSYLFARREVRGCSSCSFMFPG